MAGRAGLVLTSGGARGAYQAGVLRAIAEYVPAGANPFPVVTGVSAGSLNAIYLATRADEFRAAAEALAALWTELRTHHIFRTDTLTISRIGLGWLTDLSLGGLIGSGRGRSLLDTEPLRALLTEVLDFGRLSRNIESGALHGAAVTATNYHTGTAITFYDGHPEITPWSRTTRMGLRSGLAIEHLMASSAIPIFFPAEPIGGAYYGDGCIRLTTPLSPAIHLGADRVLAIGIRYRRPREDVVERNLKTAPHYPMMADIGGVLLNAMFLDGLEADVERMMRINQTIRLIEPNRRAEHPSQLREIPILTIHPSQDLGSLVLKTINSFPLSVRHLLKGLGASQEKGWDLLSYLAFDGAYTRPLVELGYEDGVKARSQILDFLGND